MTESIREKAVEYGAKIKYGTEICEIIPSEKKMIAVNGNSFSYENLIWCADLKFLYRNLNLQDLRANIIRNIKNQKEIFLKNRGGDSVFTLFLGIDEPLESFQSISNGHFFYTPSREGLGTSIWTRLHEIIANYENTSKRDILQWLDDYCKFNTYEISIPGLRDSKLAPERKNRINHKSSI